MILEGHILVSHPNFPSQNIFHKSIIYVYQHRPDTGAIGLILNKPSQYSISDLCREKNLAMLTTDLPIFHGGPVSTNALVLLHSQDWQSKNSVSIGSNLMITSDDVMLEKICNGMTPARYRLFAGVSGWAPGQLEAELAGQPPYDSSSSWLIGKPTQGLIFDVPFKNQWQTAFQLCGSQMFDQYF